MLFFKAVSDYIGFKREKHFIWDENGVAHQPQMPLEYKLVKITQYFGLDKEKEYTQQEINVLYEKMRCFMALDREEFPTPNLF